MRTKSLFILSTGLAGLAFATPSSAQSDDRPFNGFYVGGTVGYDFQGNDVGERIAFDRNLDGIAGDTIVTTAGADAFSPGFCDGRAQGVTRDSGCENDRSRVGYSGRIGYDQQAGPIVFGVVVEAGRSDIRDYVSAFSTTPASYTLTRRLDFNGSARARLGFAARNTLFYATGGFAYARINDSFETSNTANSFTPRGGRDGYGYVVGGGLEQKLTKNISFTVEYMRNDIETGRYLVRVGPGTAPATNPFLLGNASGTDLQRSGRNFTWESVHAGLNFRF